LKPNPKICWPFPDQVPGGILFTLMDTTMAWAIISEVEQGFSCSSLHLDIQYTALARGETFKCDARIKYKTERTHFLQAEIMDEEGKIVAIGQGTFRIFSLSK